MNVTSAHGSRALKKHAYALLSCDHEIDTRGSFDERDKGCNSVLAFLGPLDPFSGIRKFHHSLSSFSNAHATCPVLLRFTNFPNIANGMAGAYRDCVLLLVSEPLTPEVLGPWKRFTHTHRETR